MHRTQIHLGKEEIHLLELESAVTGASRSELIRRAIRDRYGNASEGRGRRPRSIGMGASGRIGAVNAKAWVRREWDRAHPTPGKRDG